METIVAPPTNKQISLEAMSESSRNSAVLRHHGRRFKRNSVSSAVISTQRTDPSQPSPSPPLNPHPPPPSLSSSLIHARPVALTPAQPPLLTSRGRPVSAKGRTRTGSYISVDFKSDFSLKQSQPLPPIGSAPTHHHQHQQQPLYEVDSAVDLEYYSHCGTPDDLQPHSLPPFSTHREEPGEGVVSNPSCRHPQFNRGVKRASGSSEEQPSSWSRCTSERWSPATAAAAVKRGNCVAGKLDDRHSIAAQLTEKDSDAPVPICSVGTAGEGRKVQVCLKLPSGERLQAEFHTSQRITDLVSYAQQYCGEDLSECEVATNEVPRQVVTDWQATLEQAGITVRTLLYLSVH